MPSTYSPNLRLELIASGEQGNSWGNTTNTNIGTLLEQAISGYKALNTGWSGNSLTLTAYNGAVDDARAMFLEVPSGVSLSATGTITAPAKPKVYVIRNTSSGGQAVTITTGSGTTSTIPNGETKIVACDGTNFHDAVTSASSFSVSSAPSDGSDVTNRTYVDAGDAARLKKDGSENMTGELILSSGSLPSNSLAAVSKQYVTSTYLPLAGGTMTGPLTLTNATPSGYQAVSKNYLDSLSVTGGTGITVNGSVASGTLSVALNPATAGTIGGVKPGSGFSVAADGTLTYSGSTGGITSVSVATANGFSGSSSGGSTPILTLGTSVNGIVQGNGSALSAATGSAIASALGSTAVTNATNATNLGGLPSTGYVRTATDINTISTSGTDVYLNVSSTSNPATGAGGGPSGVQSIRIGSHYEPAQGYNLAYIGAHSPASNPAILGFYRFEGNTPYISGSFGQGGAFTVTQLGGSGTVSLQVDNSGKLQVSSDQNLKIADGYVTDGLGLVSQLQPRYFYWKDENGEAEQSNGRQLGFFAQEVQAISPEASLTGTAINDRAIIAMLVKAVQELKAEVDALKGA